MIKYIINIPKNEPKVDSSIVSIVPSNVPKAALRTLKLNDIMIARGIIGNRASRKGKNIPMKGANQKLFWTNTLNSSSSL